MPNNGFEFLTRCAPNTVNFEKSKSKAPKTTPRQTDFMRLAIEVQTNVIDFANTSLDLVSRKACRAKMTLQPAAAMRDSLLLLANDKIIVNVDGVVRGKERTFNAMNKLKGTTWLDGSSEAAQAAIAAKKAETREMAGGAYG